MLTIHEILLVSVLPILMLVIIIVLIAMLIARKPSTIKHVAPTGILEITALNERYNEIIQSGEIYYPTAYRFKRILGQGHQGIVFLAQRQGARGCYTKHAVKLHDPSIYPSTEKYWSDMGRIASQIRKLQMVNSPQLVSRDTYEEVNGVGYTQMEVVDGVDLKYLLHGNHFEQVQQLSSPEEWNRFTDALFSIQTDHRSIQPGVTLFIMRQVLRGLEALHNAGFLHSDIKPSNIMIDRLGIVKIIDYGRAVRVDKRNTFLQGTPHYMAPEMHRREGATMQSDIYSVGIVGLELLTGKRLMSASSKSEEEMQRYKEKLPELLPDLLPEDVRENQDLISIFRKLLEPDPKKRYHSAADAESGPEGLALIHKQLTVMGIDSEYDRELERYMNKLAGFTLPQTNGVEELIG